MHTMQLLCPISPNIRIIASYFCVHIGLRPLLSVEPKGRWAVSLLQVADEKMHQEARYSCGNHGKNDGNHSNIWAIVVFHLQPWFCMLLPARYLCKPSCSSLFHPRFQLLRAMAVFPGCTVEKFGSLLTGKFDEI